MTEGEWRVGVDFNPSGDPRVNDFKKRCAALLDDLYSMSLRQDQPGSRCAAIAMHDIETGCMWAVKALTKKARDASA